MCRICQSRYRCNRWPRQSAAVRIDGRPASTPTKVAANRRNNVEYWHNYLIHLNAALMSRGGTEQTKCLKPDGDRHSGREPRTFCFANLSWRPAMRRAADRHHRIA
jgi:hypothetical protein